MIEISRQTLTPSTLNALARDLLEGSFPQIWVKGEISNLSKPASGHLYFTLKDAKAQVRCALFRGYSLRLRSQPREGMLVLARGKLTVYGARGDYQLVLDQLEDEGEGALRRAYEQLHGRLEREGLFDQERKQALPRFPQRIAVISSATGAVIKDICSVLQRRFPLTAVDLLPTNVQGEGAACQITELLLKAERSERYSVILLARGGGSLEDLWPFNDETLARTIAQLKTPCVSAIGHETDFSLCDFVADCRAPTPSVAAEMIVPDQFQLKEQLDQSFQQLRRMGERLVTTANQRTDTLVLRLQASSPKTRLSLLAHRQTQAIKGLRQATGHRCERLRHMTKQLALRLEAQAPAARLTSTRQRLQQINLRHALARHLKLLHQRMTSLHRALEAVSPLQTLGRGYVLASHASTGQLIRSSRDIACGDHLVLRFGDGSCQAVVTALMPQVDTRSGQSDA